jgi:hypothetical protein
MPSSVCLPFVRFGSRHPYGEPLLLACDPVWQAYRPAA